MPNTLNEFQHQLSGFGGGTAYNFPLNEGSTGANAVPVIDRIQGETGLYDDGVTGYQEWTTSVNGIQLAANVGVSYASRYLWVPESGWACGTGDISLGMWVRLNDIRPVYDMRVLAQHGGVGVANSWAFYLEEDEDSGDAIWKMDFRNVDSSLERYYNYYDDTDALATWTHFGITVDRSEKSAKFFINGLLHTNEYTKPSYLVDVEDEAAYISYMGGIGKMRGVISDFWYINGYACTENEMLQMMNYLGD